MRWTKPKHLIKKILTYLGVISLMISIIALNIYFLWKEGSLNFYSLDLELENSYTNKINKIKNNIKTAKSEEAKYDYYGQLLNELDGVSFLHRFYTTYVEANNYNIEFLLNNGNLKKAESIATKWIMDNPNDFNAKYKYAKVLKQTNPQQLLAFYNNLYEKHKGMHLLVSKYVDELLDRGDFSKALQVIDEAKDYLLNNSNPIFKIFFKNEQNKSFSFLNSYELSRNEYTLLNNSYHIEVIRSVENILSIRLNIGGLKTDSIIADLYFSVETQDTEYQNLMIKSISDLKHTINGELVIDGINPAIEISIPEQLNGYTGKLTIKSSMKLDNNKDHQISKISQHPDWSLSLINRVQINKNKTLRVHFQHLEDGFQYQSTIPIVETELISINLPSYINMELTDFVVSLNNLDSSLYTIDSYENLNIEENGAILITGEKPNIVYKLKEKTSVKNVNIKFRLN